MTRSMSIHVYELPVKYTEMSTLTNADLGRAVSAEFEIDT